MSPPSIQFFDEMDFLDEEDRKNGAEKRTFIAGTQTLGRFTPDGTVWIKNGLSFEKLARAMAHEMIHAWQQKEFGPIMGDVREQREQQAYEYELAVLERIGYPWD